MKFLGYTKVRTKFVFSLSGDVEDPEYRLHASGGHIAPVPGGIDPVHIDRACIN